MQRILFVCASLWAATLVGPAGPASAWYAGVGYSTVTSGRKLPALNVGANLSKDFVISGMTAGARTQAYFVSGYMLNGMWSVDWGKFWFGRLETAIGFGAYYGRKGVYTQVDANGKPYDLAVDVDTQIGPSFRVAFKPLGPVYIGVEYNMGLDVGIFAGAWPATGLGAIGIEL